MEKAKWRTVKVEMQEMIPPQEGLYRGLCLVFQCALLEGLHPAGLTEVQHELCFILGGTRRDVQSAASP